MVGVWVIRKGVISGTVVAFCVGLAGCGGEPSSPKTDFESARQPAQSRSSFGPVALRTARQATARELKFVLRAPGGAKPNADGVVRVALNETIRYWIAPWTSPDGDPNFFCLYTGIPKSPGPTTSCFGAAEFDSGRALSYTTTRDGVEFVGFVPRGWRVAVIDGARDRRLRVSDGVYAGSAGKRADGLAVTNPAGARTVLRL